MSLVLRMLKGRRLRVAALATASLVAGLGEAAFLVLMTRMALALTGQHKRVELWGHRQATIATALGIAVALVVVRISVALWSSWQSAELTAAAVARARSELSSAFLNSSWATQHSDKGGQLQELVTTNASQVMSFLSAFTSSVAASFSLLALLGTALAINLLGALGVVLGALVLGLLLRPVRSTVLGLAQAKAVESMALASSLNQVSQLGLEVQVFGVHEEVQRELDQLIRRREVAERRLEFSRGIVSPTYVGLAYLALVVGLGVVHAIGTTNVAAMGAVMLVMLRSLSYGQAIQNSSASALSSIPYLSSMNEQLERYRLGRRTLGGSSLDEVAPIEFSNVTFGYDPQRSVLRGISVSIGQRQVVGIVGPSGSGKSTFVQLLLGLREPSSGSITANGLPLDEIRREDLVRKITFVPQSAHLISGTIEDNIRFYRPDAAFSEVQYAARLAHLEDEILALPDGFRHWISGSETGLSGGQAQRLSIARALLESPQVLILDEPTSALDVESEAAIRETLQLLSREMTVVIVAHRLSTLNICDMIMVIQDGELKAFDSPEALASSNRFYSNALKLSGLR